MPGDYYFRFKFEFMEKSVWSDFNNPVGALPRYDGKIIMKVTKLSWENKNETGSLFMQFCIYIELCMILFLFFLIFIFIFEFFYSN